jgi:hypothetical protein
MSKHRSVSPRQAAYVASLEATLQQVQELQTLRQDLAQMQQERDRLSDVLADITRAIGQWRSESNGGTDAR